MSGSCSQVRRPTLCGWALFVLLGGVWVLASQVLAADEEASKEFSRGVLIRFEGVIMPRLEQYLYRKLEAAKADGADLVIVEIDSPGGHLEASLALARTLRDLDWAHTVAYVPRQALSGAAIMALGCDEIIMDPDAKLGDAGPIFQDEDFLFRHAPEKVRSDLARDVRDLAEAKGRPPALAEAMVDMDLLVYPVTNTVTGQKTFMSDTEIQSDPNPDQWQKGPPVHESHKNHFLEVNGRRAVELQLAEGSASSRNELKDRYGLKGELPVLQPTAVDTAVYVLNHPVVTGLLFVVGLVALYIEFSAPGIGIGGLTAVLCFALFFWSRVLGGTAGWLEVVLFVSGAAFLAVELLVLPGFGVAGLTGVLLLVAALILAGQTFIIPETNLELSILAHTLAVLTFSGVAFVIAAVYLSRHFGAIPVLSRLALRPPDAAELAKHGAKAPDAAVHASRRRDVQIGDTGIADSPLRPAGKARFGDRYADVVTDGDFITKGSRVEIVEIRGNRVVVREVEEKQ